MFKLLLTINHYYYSNEIPSATIVKSHSSHMWELYLKDK